MARVTASDKTARTAPKQKVRAAEAAAEAEAPVGVPPAEQKLDDRTAIDDLTAKKRNKEKLPAGFKHRLPAGVKRTVKVDRNELNGQRGDKPFLIYENGKLVAQTDKIRVEGDADMVTQRIQKGSGCGAYSTGSAHMETEASVLIGTKKKQ
jgi:hypothetical protein